MKSKSEKSVYWHKNKAKGTTELNICGDYVEIIRADGGRNPQKSGITILPLLIITGGYRVPSILPNGPPSNFTAGMLLCFLS